MLKGRIRAFICGEIYWFAKQVNGRHSMISLETRDYVEAVQRAREIMDALEPRKIFAGTKTGGCEPMRKDHR